MKNIILVVVLIGSLFTSIFAQNPLTLSSAKSITLENNFGIQIAKNDLKQARNLTDKRVNGYLPIVGADVGLNGNLGSASQTFSNGLEASTSNAFNWGANASVGANYTILDKGRDLRLEQSQKNYELSNLQLKQSIEQNLLIVYNGYFQVAQLEENIQFLKEAIVISRERKRRAQIQLDFGKGNGLDVLNVEVDIQRDSVNLLNALMNLDNAKRNLNVAMGRDSEFEYQLAAIDPNNSNLVLEDLLENARSTNTSLLINKQLLAVNEMNLDIIDAEKKPNIFAGASYGINYSDNASGSFIDQSNSRGLNGNLGLSWTLYDGSRDLRSQNVLLDLANQKLQIENLRQQLDRDIRNAWSNYQNAINILEVEKNALDLNQENFERTSDRVQAGQLSSIEFRQAQLNLLNAQISLTRARIDVRQREVELMQLAGLLTEELEF